MKPLCIVTARGGSKRIPKKNLKDFLGKPLVAWPVSVAVKSKLFDNVLISTDDQEIADAAIREGAIYPFIRPKNVSDDYSTTSDVLRATLEQWYNFTNILPDYCCCLYGTSVFVTQEILNNILKMKSKDSCIMAVSEYAHPVQRALRRKMHNELEYLYPDKSLYRTQDCEKFYHDIGLVYCFAVKEFLRCGAQFQKMKIEGLIVPKHQAIDIDTNEDWILAEMLAKSIGISK